MVGGLVKTSASIKSNFTFGSWSEYGVIANGTINGAGSGAAFANGGLSTPTGSFNDIYCNASKLSFSNTPYASSCNATTIGKYPNNITIANIASKADNFPGNNPITSNTTNLIAGGTYTAGNITLEAGNLVSGKSIIIKSSGDVIINGNQTYDSGPFTSIAQIPQLVIFAKNITINDSVTEVNAWLVASNSIKTCSDVARKVDVCASELKVNGPVITKQLYLWRTAGSGIGANSGDPAEIFNLRADTYLWSMNRAISSGRIQTVYTAELPPRL